MKAICFTVPTNKHLLGEKRTSAKLQSDISKSEGLVRVYTDGQTNMGKSAQLVTLIIYICIYFIGFPKYSFGCYKHPDKRNTRTTNRSKRPVASFIYTIVMIFFKFVCIIIL